MTRNEGRMNSPTSSSIRTQSGESKQTPDSTSTRRTTSMSSQSQEGRDTVGQANLRSENSLQDPAQYTTSRMSGDASGPTTPWESVACSTSWPMTPGTKNVKEPSALEDPSNSRRQTRRT